MARRRVIAGLVLSGLGLVSVGTARGVAAPAPQTGHADATVTLPKIVITDPTGSAHTVELGSVGSGAVTDTGLLASLGLRGAALLGTPLPDWQVDSGSGPMTGDSSVPL